MNYRYFSYFRELNKIDKKIITGVVDQTQAQKDVEDEVLARNSLNCSQYMLDVSDENPIPFSTNHVTDQHIISSSHSDDISMNNAPTPIKLNLSEPVNGSIIPPEASRRKMINQKIKDDARNSSRVMTE